MYFLPKNELLNNNSPMLIVIWPLKYKVTYFCLLHTPTDDEESVKKLFVSHERTCNKFARVSWQVPRMNSQVQPIQIKLLRLTPIQNAQSMINETEKVGPDPLINRFDTINTLFFGWKIPEESHITQKLINKSWR